MTTNKPPRTNSPSVSEARPKIAYRLLRVSAVLGVIALLVYFAAGPVRISLHPTLRREHLLKAATQPSHISLSPLATALHRHVKFLARDVGSRPIYDWEAQARARDYILEEFRRAGYTPRLLEYENEWLPSAPGGRSFANIEAILEGRAGHAEGIYVIGSHYDTADGTPGADDNTSGVAVMLECARLLRNTRPAHNIHFVAFGTEEPPSFGTKNMGSRHYAQNLKTGGTKVRTMVSLEMLGYFSDRPGFQLYPPFLQLFFPDRGNFICLVSNIPSAKSLRQWKNIWQSVSNFPLETMTFPPIFSNWALSDQLNFWDAGYPALMLSDTAFFRNPHYHEPSDKPETLDYNKMAQITDAVAIVLQSINK